MDELRTWWEVPCIGQFVSLFRFAFSLPEIDIEDLEEGFLADWAADGSSVVQSLLFSLLQGIYPRVHISLSNWENFLHKVLKKKWVKEEKRADPLPEGTTFSQLSLRAKVEIVYSLCFYRLELDDVAKAMKSMDADALRVQPLGRDEEGNVYWYFYGTRLYKEAPSAITTTINKRKDLNKTQTVTPKRGRGRPRKIQPIKSDGESDDFEHSDGTKKCLTLDSKSRWSVVCTTLEEWKLFAEKFKTSESKCEIELYQIIQNNFLPVLSTMYEAKEKQAQEKKELLSSRSSSRIENQKRKSDKVKKTSTLKQSTLSHNDSETEIVNSSSNRKKRLLNHCEIEKTCNLSSRAARLERKTRKIEESNFIETCKSEGSDSEAVSSTGVLRDHNMVDKNLSYEPELILKLRKVLSSVKLHKDAWPFMYPVDDLAAPGYYDIIKEPVDLSSIERKIELKVYSTLGQIDQDFQKLVANCRLYNGEKSAYTSMALTLLRVFKKGVAEVLLPASPVENNQTTANALPESAKKAKLDDVESIPSSIKSRPKSKKLLKQKKRTRVQSMMGLEMLAEASEQALKDVGKTEGELYVVDAPGNPMKSKSFPDLKIVTIQNHPPSFVARCKRSSISSRSSIDSDASARDSTSPASVCSRGSEEGSNHSGSEKPCQPISRRATRLSDSYASDKDVTKSCATQKPVSPDSCYSLLENEKVLLDSISNERFSNNESNNGSPKSLSDFSDNGLDIPSDMSRTDLINNLSKILGRMVKENQAFQLSDSQNLLYVENSDTNLSSGSFGPPTLDMSTADDDGPEKNISEERPPSSPSPINNDSCLLPPPQLEVNRDFMGLSPIDNITTVDASAIGISTIPSNSNNKISSNAQKNKESFTNKCTSMEVDKDISDSPGIAASSPVPSQCTVESDAHNLREVITASNTKEKLISPDSNIGISSEPISDPLVLQQNLPSYNPFSTGLVNSYSSSESSPYSAQPPFRISPPAATSLSSSFPEFLLPRMSDNRLAAPVSLPSQLPLQLPVPTTMSFLMNQGPQVPTSLPLTNFSSQSTSYAPSMSQPSQPVLGSTVPFSSSNFTSCHSSQLYNTQSDASMPVANGNKKLPIKPLTSSTKNSGLKRDSSPRQIKKKRSIVVAQNQQNNLIIGTNVTKTIHASVSETSQTESVSEQLIPAESTPLYKLSNLVSSTHTKHNDTVSDARFPVISSSSMMDNNTKVNSSLFVPYNGNVDNGNCGIPQAHSFWAGKDNKVFYNIPSTHSMPFSVFQPPTSTVCNSLPAIGINGSYYVTTSNNKPQPVNCMPSQPVVFDSSTSSSSNVKSNFTSLPPPPPGNNILTSAQPFHTLSPNSLQQLPDSRTFSPPENQKDLQGFLSQKSLDGIFHTHGIQNVQAFNGVATQQMIPQSFVNLPPSYVLPVQPPVPSIISQSMLSNFIVNSKSPDGSLPTPNDVRSQFAAGRSMPIYTILQNVPPKILQ